MNDAAEKLEETQEETQEEVKGLGETLREKRQSLGLELDDIAKKLHLKPSLLADIETEQYDPALSVTFTKGYIRLYAKQLGLQPEGVLALFDKHEKLEKQPTKLRSFSQKVAKQASDARLMMVTYFIITVVIGLVIVWWVQQDNEAPVATQDYTQNNTSDDSERTAINPVKGSDSSSNTSFEQSANNEQDTDVSEPVSATIEESYTSQSQGLEAGPESTIDAANNGESTEADEQQSQQFSQISEDSFATGNASESVIESTSFQKEAQRIESGHRSDNSIESNAAISDTADVSATITDDFSSTEPQMLELVFEFNGDCWMNLTDATGEVVAYGVKESGYVMPVSGVPPFEVVLGAPQVVSITIDGEAFDMSAFPEGRTARFMIGAEE